MSEVLLIRLGSVAGDVIPWLVWSDTEQEVIASGEVDDAAALSTLAERGEHREVRVLVPASDLTLKTVTLPGKLSRQLLSALPFMLEEDLAQDVEDLFFAIGNKTTVDDKPAVEVAIVARGLLETWQRWLSDAGLHSTVMLPDALCLPDHEGVTGIELNQQWLVRHQGWHCNSVDDGWFEDYLGLAAAHHVAESVDDSEQETEALVFNSYSPCDKDIKDLTVVEQSAELPLELLLKHSAGIDFNLMQGEYSQKKEGSKTWGIWRQAAIVAGVAILLQLTFRGSIAWQLNGELEAEKATFVSQYRKAFPNETRTRTALMERQLKNKLKSAQSGEGGDSGFLVMLDQVAPVFKSTQGITPNSIKFDSKRSELRLQATGDGFQSFEKFKSAVENLGYEVQQGSLNNDGDKVVGAITIKRAG